VIHIFAPLSTQPSGVGRAVVIMPPGSLPKSGSVRPKQPMASPRAIAGSQRSFCASEPKWRMGNITSEPCTEQNERTPESPRSSSWQMSPYETSPMPAQP
jgi:hypothetical protein